MSYLKELNSVQVELNAAKSQYNKFGKYYYRSCEDILQAVKPLLKKHEAQIVINDDISLVGDRVYVKATAVFYCASGEISSCAFAREPLTKKGMDEAQITGSTSSYARKYALNGLLLIDDNKDADTKDNSNEHVDAIANSVSEFEMKSKLCESEKELKEVFAVCWKFLKRYESTSEAKSMLLHIKSDYDKKLKSINDLRSSDDLKKVKDSISSVKKSIELDDSGGR